MSFVISYVATGLVFLALDAVWLGLAASRLYRPMIGGLMADRIDLPAAIIFYLLYIAGLTVFAVQPALASGRWMTALLLGGFFGLVAYGTYDLTNQATLKNWPAMMSMIDMAWGTLLSAAAATLGMLITRMLVGGTG